MYNQNELNVFMTDGMFYSYIYYELSDLNDKLPILTYEYGLDGYTLFEVFMVPIWTEQCGFM